jgi:glycosyltransferase involved in cell wall biosynthesis
MMEAKRYGVADKVKLIGAVTEEEKSWYYEHCKAFVFPSRGEGFGLPVVEAMHFGKPVFLSASTSLPEVGGDAAYYFESFDPAAMQRVFENGMNDFNNHDRVVTIKQQAEKFSWDKAAREYLDVYRNCLQK